MWEVVDSREKRREEDERSAQRGSGECERGGEKSKEIKSKSKR